MTELTTPFENELLQLIELPLLSRHDHGKRRTGSEDLFGEKLEKVSIELVRESSREVGHGFEAYPLYGTPDAFEAKAAAMASR